MTNQQKDEGQDESGVELQQTRRLKVHGVVYEEFDVVGGKGHIRLSGENIKEQDLTDDDINNIVRFFVGFQRRQNRDAGAATDGRGQVRDPAHDARLKGNEDQRPTDPTRAKQTGKGNR